MGNTAPPEEIKGKLLGQLENPHLKDEEIEKIERKLKILDAQKQ